MTHNLVRVPIAMLCIRTGLFLLVDKEVSFNHISGASGVVTQECSYLHLDSGTSFAIPSHYPGIVTDYSAGDLQLDLGRIKFLSLSLLQTSFQTLISSAKHTPISPKHPSDLNFCIPGTGSFQLDIDGRIKIRFQDSTLLLYSPEKEDMCSVISREGDTVHLRLMFPLGYEREVAVLRKFLLWIRKKEASPSGVDVAGVLKHNSAFLEKI